MSLLRLPTPEAAVQWLRERVRGSLRTDSRSVRIGDGFIAWPGYATDGRQYVAGALQAGAAAALVEDEGAEPFGFDDPRIAALPGLKAATGPIASLWCARPSEHLQVLAATGTNGKSSTAWWTAQALTLLGRRCGVVGTLGVGEPPTPANPQGAIQATGLTTPDPVTLQAALRRMVDAGYQACAIEASSIGIVEHRLAGTRIAVAQFTNFTRDHLDYHGSMEAYWAAKCALFDWPGLRAAVVNIDDDAGALLAARLGRGDMALWTTSVGGTARLEARGLGYVGGGLSFSISEAGQTLPVRSSLIGDFNASNLLGVLATLRALGVPLADAVAVVPQLSAVPGRMERVPGGPGLPEVVVDYAHTPDALDKALAALRPMVAARGGRLWCVFGCGGNRDATKRPLMGGIAERGADRVVITSDNPRGEAPGAILAQVAAGLADPRRAEQIEDRRAAIARAVAWADATDVVLVAGKGHEDYQEVGGARLPFSDVAEAGAALRARGAA